MIRTVLDLCGGTGAWSRPYAEAGYDVRVVDPCRLGTCEIDRTLCDVRLLEFDPDLKPHGILAAPPCTMFCRMRMCRGEPSNDQFREALSIVDACLRAVILYRPKWWALENPQGYLRRWLGAPRLKFDPCDYGDRWTKNTWVWGDFVPPLFRPVAPAGPLIHRKAGRRGLARGDAENAITPPGFARAFFEANP